MSMRAVSEIVGNVLMLLIVTALISEAFLYGMPLLRKRIDKVTVSSMEEGMKTLADAIEATALQGGETKVRIETKSRFSSPPEIRLVRDSTGEYYIEMRTSSESQHYAPQDVPLDDVLPAYDNTKTSKLDGVVGINKPVVIMGRSTKTKGGIRTFISAVPRPIKDPSKNTIVKIVLQPMSGKSSKTSVPTTIVVKKAGEKIEVKQENIGGEEVTTTYRTITVEVGFE